MRKVAVRIVVVLAVLAVQQSLTPFGLAQIPCGEVEQALGICPTPSPSHSERPEHERPRPSPNESPGPEMEAGTGPFILIGPKDTSTLVGLLSRLQPYGINLRKALLSVVGPFPVAGLAWWANDWHAPRCCPYPHEHQGLDIFARKGTPLVAAANGFVSQKVDQYPSGKGIEITDPAGTEYFYAHLSAFARNLQVGDEVVVGDVIGYVGSSGNARHTTPHLHFEIQPGGVPTAPKPIVDRWLQIAERRALFFVRETAGSRALLDEYDFRLTRLFDLTAGTDAVGQMAEELLGLAGLHPGLPSIEVARQTLSDMSWEIDWGLRADEELALLAGRSRSALMGTEFPYQTPWSPLGSLLFDRVEPGSDVPEGAG
jgi:hypothetical protein